MNCLDDAARSRDGHLMKAQVKVRLVGGLKNRAGRKHQYPFVLHRSVPYDGLRRCESPHLGLREHYWKGLTLAGYLSLIR